MSKQKQIIKVRTDVWTDNNNQLQIKKTIRQMRSLTEGDHYEFEDVVRCEPQFSDEEMEVLAGLSDGLYIMHCEESTGMLEYGEYGDTEYTFDKFEKDG